MMKHRLFTIDFIFFYISLFLIAWMGVSHYVDSKIDNEYARTVKVRAGYEIRDFATGILTGDKIEFASAFWWKEIEGVKEKLRAKNIEFVEYPYFIRQNLNGTSEVFFNVVKGSQVESFEGLSVAFPLTNTAFLEYKWYPTKSVISKTKEVLVRNLEAGGVEYYQDETWIEIRNPFYTIPFMMKSGIFVDLLETK